MKYNLVLPTATEQASGWSQGSAGYPEFVFENKGEEIVKGSIRLNGLLTVQKNIAGVVSPVTALEKPILDPDAGIHGFIKNLNVTLGTSTAENILQYNRFVKMKNEAKRFQIDSCTDTHSMCELQTFSNDANIANTDIKTKAYSGVLIPSTAGAYEVPFSVVLDICLNNSDENIPFSKTGKIKLTFNLEDMTKTGFMCLNPTANTSSYQYYMKNLEIRYMTEPEKESYGGIILETKTSSHTPTIQNKIASLEFQSTSAFDAVLVSFINNTTVTTLDNKTKNYLQTEAIAEKVGLFEVKINGQNDVLKFPLKFQTAEILSNYLQAWRPYIQAYDDVSIDKHGLSYKKLAQANQTAGYGLGCAFHGGLEAGTKVQLNLSLNSVPANPYQCFIYTIGSLII